jgi:hypothetical protein
MRQHSWLELLKDNDCYILYHPRKANVVADDLSRKSQSASTNSTPTRNQLANQLGMIQLDVAPRMKCHPTAFIICQLTADRIKIAQENDLGLQQLKEKASQGKAPGFNFTEDDLLRTGDARTVIPNDAELRRDILNEAHKTRYTEHPGSTKMYQDLRKGFWWQGMKHDIAEYVAQCPTCQQVKAEHQRPANPLQPLNVPEWKWDQIAMDFVVGLPKTLNRHDAILVVIDRLTKNAHFTPIKVADPVPKLVELYIREIARLHGIPASIVSDRDARFTSRFSQCLHDAMGTKLTLSTTYHPQTNGQSERTIQILEDMLRLCVLDFKGKWIQYLPLVEFAYNNSFQATIGMAPCEALYGRKCRSPLYWDEVGKRQLVEPEIIQDTKDKIILIRKRMLAVQSCQKSYADT